MMRIVEVLLVGGFAAGWLAFHRAAISRRDRSLLAILLLFDVLCGGLAVVAVASPALFVRWMQEDSWVEWSTFAAFAAAAIVTGAALVRSWRSPGPLVASLPRWLRTLGFAGLAAFCLFVAGEEISWGQRLLGLEPPEVFLAHNAQQELNLHNFLKDQEVLAVDLDSRYLVAMIAIGYAGLLPGLAALLRRRRPAWAAPVEAFSPPLPLVPWFAAVVACELIYPVELGGEACELVLGVLFLVDALLRHAAATTAPDAAAPRRAALAIGAVFAFGLAAPVVVDGALSGADLERTAQAQGELQELARDLVAPGTLQPRLRTKSVHKRVFTAVQAGYLVFAADSQFLGGAARRDRVGYFLDPWNNPYWIRHARRSDAVLLYSFGPNRRRDSDLDRSSRLGGDDIGVEVSLTPPPTEVSSALTDASESEVPR